MRILFITHFLPPLHNAGTENYTLGLVKSFLKLGHEVELLCAEDWDNGEHYWNGVTREDLNGSVVYRIHLNWLKHKNPNHILYDSSEVEAWLDGFLEQNHYDLVHVTSAITLGIGILRSVKKKGIPLVLTLMDFWFICPSIQLLRSDASLCDGMTTDWECQYCLLENSKLFHRISHVELPNATKSKIFGVLSQMALISKQRGLRGMLLNMKERKSRLPSALSLADVILTHSAVVRDLVGQNTHASIEVLRNGYSPAWTGSLSHKEPSKWLRFGYIGQIHKIKGVDVIIRAFKLLAEPHNARLNIWGDYSRNPQYAQELSNLIGESETIQLQGRFSQADLGNVLSEIDVLIVPSIWYENSPLVIQEAFSAKIPVIATKLGGMAELVIHNVNGLLFERRNAEDLARQMKTILDDPRVLPALQAGIQSLVSVDEEVFLLEQIYKKLIDRYNIDYKITA